MKYDDNDGQYNICLTLDSILAVCSVCILKKVCTSHSPHHLILFS